MKRSLVYLLTCLVMVALVFSCKKDDPAAPSIVGTWKFSSFTDTNCTDPGDNSSETCTGGVSDCGSLTFTATNYTYTPPTGGGTAENGTYTISGSTLTATASGSTSMVLTFTVTATTLTLVEVNATSGCTSTTVLTKV